MKYDYKIRLLEMAEPKYKEFSSSLIPNIPKDEVMGVRLPKIRKLADEIIKNDFCDFINSEVGETLEERLLRAFVIAKLNCPFSKKKELIEAFIPFINSWSVCDSFCAALKIKENEKNEVWQFLESYFTSDKPYEIRFAVVMALNYFSDVSYAKEAFKIFNSIKNEDYYVEMAVAWAVSVYFVNEPQFTLSYLENNELSDDTHNKAIQKIRESLRVSAEVKENVKKLKR